MKIVILFIIGARIYQSNWMGGAGRLLSEGEWGSSFYSSQSVTCATEGQVSLVASEWDYSRWEEVIIDYDSGIPHHTQGLMPADVDRDGITDVVAHTDDEVVWYKNDGNYNFTPVVVGAASDGGVASPCVFPIDVDGDKDIDILVGTAGVGVGWYENVSGDGSRWSFRYVYGGQFHRVCGGDIDNNGHVDIVAVDNSDYRYAGTIHVFKNDGRENFSISQRIDPGWNQGWRVYLQDFNKDGYLDMYSCLYEVYIYLNDRNGNFYLSWHQDFWSRVDFDGAWPRDIDMDGDIDLVVAGYSGSPDRHFYALLNDGTGTNFTLHNLGTGGYDYTDGAISADIDLDGYPDIAGTYYKTAWFRQIPGSRLQFEEYFIDEVEGNTSHWIFIHPMKTCSPLIDILVTEGSYGHKIYINKMIISLNSEGELVSSILERSEERYCWFGYKCCCPYEGEEMIAFYYRTGNTVQDVITTNWEGPYWGRTGEDSVEVFKNAKLFQYKVEWKAKNDKTAILYEVWVSTDCLPTGVEEEIVEKKTVVLKVVGEELILRLPSSQKVHLKIYDVGGRLVSEVHKDVSEGEYRFGFPVKRGVYFAKMRIGEREERVKLVKLR